MDENSSKRDRALNVIEDAGTVLSTQIINEVCCNLLRKAGYNELEIQQTVTNFCARYPILNVTTDIIYRASQLRISHSFSYWDSVVVATAMEANCDVIFSEDMHNGLQIGDLKIVNPFL